MYLLVDLIKCHQVLAFLRGYALAECGADGCEATAVAAFGCGLRIRAVV
jgi:hypothetical protein